MSTTEPTPTDAPKKTSTMGTVIGIIAVLLCAGYIVSLWSGPSYSEMTCSQLTTEMLKMTGTNATEEYDLDKVRAINDARKTESCW